jgi:hypothetical protein
MKYVNYLKPSQTTLINIPNKNEKCKISPSQVKTNLINISKIK